MSKTLSIDLIRTEGDMQGRAEFSPEHIADLKAAWEAKADLPPLLVFFDGTDYWLADGFHRLDAAKLAKRASVQCDIEKGTRRDAWMAALKANQVHGLRRTNADKRKVVTRALSDAELVTWADSRIAEYVGVCHTFVSGLRRQLATVASSLASQAADKPRVGKDGKARKQPTPKAETNPQAVSISENKENKPAVKQYKDEFNTQKIEGEKVKQGGIKGFDEALIDTAFRKLSQAIDEHYTGLKDLYERRFNENSGGVSGYNKSLAIAKKSQGQSHDAINEALKALKSWRAEK